MAPLLQFAACAAGFRFTAVGAPERAEIRLSAPRQLQTETTAESTALRSLRPAIAHVTDLETASLPADLATSR